MNEQLLKLIELCLVDGVITDKERNVIFRKAQELGVEEDKCEIILNSMIQKHSIINTQFIEEQKIDNKKWIINSLDDTSFSSSSEYNGKYNAKYGRITYDSTLKNWAAKTKDKNQWLQIDLVNEQFITGVAVQGSATNKDWIILYNLWISNDLINWTKLENIVGSKDNETISSFFLTNPIQGRYVRFLPQEWQRFISMRVDIQIMDKHELSKINSGKSDNIDIYKQQLLLNENDPLYFEAYTIFINNNNEITEDIIKSKLKVGSNRARIIYEQLISNKIIITSQNRKEDKTEKDIIQSIPVSELVNINSTAKKINLLNKVGETFNGEWIDNTSEIKGKLISKDGDFWEGTFSEFNENNFEFKCMGTYHDNNGNLIEKGEFVNRKLNGIGSKYYDDGTLFKEGNFVDGELNGNGKRFYENGILCQEGNFINSELNGKGKMYNFDFIDGKLIGNGKLSKEGDFKDGQLNGIGKEFYSDGGLWFEGEFKDGVLNGKGKEYVGINLRREGEFKDGKLNGMGKQFDFDSSLMFVGEFINGEIKEDSVLIDFKKDINNLYENDMWEKLIDYVLVYELVYKDFLNDNKIAQKYLWALKCTDNDKAYSEVDRILKLNTDNSFLNSLKDTIGLIYLKKGKSTKNIDLLNKALQYFESFNYSDKEFGIKRIDYAKNIVTPIAIQIKLGSLGVKKELIEKYLNKEFKRLWKVNCLISTDLNYKYSAGTKYNATIFISSDGLISEKGAATFIKAKGEYDINMYHLRIKEKSIRMDSYSKIEIIEIDEIIF